MDLLLGDSLLQRDGVQLVGVHHRLHPRGSHIHGGVVHILLAVDVTVVFGSNPHCGHVVSSNWDHVHRLPWAVFITVLGGIHVDGLTGLSIDYGLVELGGRPSTSVASSQKISLELINFFRVPWLTGILFVHDSRSVLHQD